jgi:hypothetical protein
MHHPFKKRTRLASGAAQGQDPCDGLMTTENQNINVRARAEVHPLLLSDAVTLVANQLTLG